MSLQWIAGKKIESPEPTGADFLTVIKAIQTVSQGFQDLKKTSSQKIREALENFIQKTATYAISQPSSNLQSNVFSQKELSHFLRRAQVLLETPDAMSPPLGPSLIFGSQSSPLLRLLPVLSALRSGCTVVFLVSSRTAASYISLIERLVACGFSETAVAVLTTSDSESLETLVSHPSLRALHFHGHEFEGEFLKKNRLPLFEKRFKIHFGGKNPVIFTHDADLANLKDLLINSFDNTYLAEHRFHRWFVQEKNYALFAEKVLSLDGELRDLFIKTNLNVRVNESVCNMQNESLLKEKNWQVLPLSKVSINFDFNNCSPWHQRESIGPHLTITRFKNANEVIKFANTTSYASASCVIAATAQKAEDLSRQLTMPHHFNNAVPDMGAIDSPLGLVGCGFGNEKSDLDFFNF